jgi:hypothetical protein
LWLWLRVRDTRHRIINHILYRIDRATDSTADPARVRGILHGLVIRRINTFGLRLLNFVFGLLLVRDVIRNLAGGVE